jgi:MFS family permease
MRFSLKLNPVVRNFILSDMILFSGWGLVSPIFSVFVLEDIAGATLVTIGINTGIYWLVRSCIQLPLAGIIDRVKGEKDDFYILVVGLLLISTAAFAFTTAETIRSLWIIQVIYAAGFAFYASSWSAIFSRHLDPNRVAFSWSLDSTGLGITSGITGLLGGILAERYGFSMIFIITGLMSLASAIIIFIVPDIVFPYLKRRKPVRVDHLPSALP